VVGRTRKRARPLDSTPTATTSGLIPCLLLKHGDVYLPAGDGPIPARTPEGDRYDPFDVVDRLSADYPLLYLVDLDGVDTGEPQLDFLQELTRDATLWVDGGVRTADQAIDVLVAGAQRAVLSSAMLRGPRELARAWKLSTELAFELELDARGLVATPEWTATDPLGLVQSVRAVGVDHCIVSPREIPPDWSLMRTVAAGGPTWVNGSFEPADLPRAQDSGARGGIFHIDRLLGEMAPTRSQSVSEASATSRDDDNKNQLKDDE
jgi:Histidine biosynthesis protein